MPNETYQADLPQARQLLLQWLAASTDAPAMDWLQEKTVSFETAKPLREFYLAFGLASRMAGKKPLLLTDGDLQDARNLRRGLNPTHWTTDQTARILLLLTLPHENPDDFLKILNQLSGTADVGELTAVYRAFPLLPHPQALRARAAEGIRTSMDVVFNAVAVDNPYPGEYLDEAAWNQLILKAVFIGTPLGAIQGLDTRANPTLARILRDYAHERWAAGRPVTPELWRLVAPFAGASLMPDLERLFARGDEAEQEAAALACANSRMPEALQLLREKRPDLAERIASVRWIGGRTSGK